VRGVAAGTNLWHAIRIVVIADIVMSLDKRHRRCRGCERPVFPLLVLGLAISIPMIIAGRGA